MSLFCWTQRKIFWRKFVTRLFWGTIDFHSRKKNTMEVNGAPELLCFPHSSEYLPLCSAEQRHSYRFGTTWGWVNDDRIFIFGWTIPLRSFLRYFRMHFLVFRIRHPFLSKFLLRMQKRRKLNLVRIFLLWLNVSEAVCKRDWHNMRSYLFFNVWKFRTIISDSMCKDLYSNCCACRFSVINESILIVHIFF